MSTPAASKRQAATGDRKVSVSARVSADDRDWLKAQAEREQRDVGVVLARAITLYRAACAQSGFDDPSNAAAMPAAVMTPDGPRQLGAGGTS